MSYTAFGFVHRDVLDDLPYIKRNMDLGLVVGLHTLQNHIWEERMPHIDPKWFDGDVFTGVKVFWPYEAREIRRFYRNKNYVYFPISKGN